MNHPKQINIPLEKLKTVSCHNCGGEHFIPVFLLRKLPALLSPNGQEQLLQIPVFRCTSCETIYIDELTQKTKS